MPDKGVRTSDHIIAGLETIGAGDVVVLGVPWDGGSSFLRGAADAPAQIRAELLSPARNLITESGRDLGHEPRFKLLEDLSFAAGRDPNQQIESAVSAVVDRGGRPLCLGGDHSITAAAVPACSRRLETLTLLQIDAHPDLYDEFDGKRDSHACPMARIMERGLVDRLVQLGIRALTPPQHEQARRFGVEVLEMRQWRSTLVDQLELAGPLYVSIDLDGLDPAFAPGVSHPEPGGFSTRELIELLQRLPAPVVAADLVELNPLRDPTGLTAVVAAKLIKELSEVLLEPPP